ncbi:MAG: gamma carbonic anhydrase family protein [Polyangiaceae bacterium]
MPVYALGDKTPVLGKNVWIAPNASVIGDVTLGDDVSIWFGVVLRGDCGAIRIGARTNVQDGTVVHVTGGKANTTVGEDVTIGHMALLHGCTVEDRALVGMGSILLDNCVVGHDSFVAAGALVSPGTVVPPRSMVMGRPARVVRAIEERDLVWTQEASRLYLGYAEEHRTSLREIPYAPPQR